jgi:protein-S-isoprenylcysteine O-methyltransferase Ste14
VQFCERLVESLEEKKKKMTQEEEKVEELAEKVRRGELTHKEVGQEMEKRGLLAHAGELFPGMYSVTGLIIWGFLCFFPPILTDIFKITLPAFLTQLPEIVFPTPIKWVAAVLFFSFFYFFGYSAYVRKRKGGGTEEHTIFVVKEGPYGIVRHPEFLGVFLQAVTGLIILSPIISFNFLILLGGLVAFVGIFLQSRNEERFNVRKWGDKYRQYQKEVPRFNFVLGLWRRAKRKNKQGSEINSSNG